MAKIKGQADPSVEDDEAEDEILELEIAAEDPDPLVTPAADAADDGADDADPLDDLPKSPVQQPQVAATDPRLVAVLQQLAEGHATTAAQVAQLNSDRLDIAEQQIDGQITALIAQRGDALTNGDMAAFNQLDAQLSDARLRKGRVDQIRASMKAAPARTPKIEIPTTAAEPPAPKQAPQARAWIAKNPWFDDAGGDEASDIAITISRQLAERGITANDPRHYEEIDKRMSKLYPQHYKGRGDQRKPAAASGARAPTQQSQGGKDKVTISPRLARNFELAGFDINDPKVRSQMAKAARETQQAHLVRGGR
jgi:hypothetical protein